MAVLPPLPRMLFRLGYVTEQALVVNVPGFGLVLISGCGHPRIEQILGVTEQVLDIPIRAVVGGLHLPVHAAGTPLIPQAVPGNPHPPWQPISERGAEHVLEEIEARGAAGHRPVRARQHPVDLRCVQPPLWRPLPHAASR
jgi:7,8-dihydropterin-6-yl-methyl-4-(beta-D-ribofuranosyl)aminobenzene 5'-phosphate synthase